MKAVLLAGGMGTRMREETEFRPKPMVEVGGQPILWHIMRNLAHFGITDFIIASGYMSQVIDDYFRSHEGWTQVPDERGDGLVELRGRDRGKRQQRLPAFASVGHPLARTAILRKRRRS